ncbi:hypothetical protein IJS18_01625 [Candidatus Saccharibacteria bacterium]|nr:hypothetical protein [Candidatus Saccharibacteria bacterium]
MKIFQKKQNRITRSHLSILFSIIFLFPCFFFASAFAEEEAPIIPPLQISPTSRRVSLNQKEKKTGTIEITNYGNETITFKVYPTPYSNEGDTRNFENESYYTKLSKWIMIQNDAGAYRESVTFKIEAKKTKKVSYRIVVPENAPPGGQYATIFTETIPTEKNDDDIQTVTRAGMLIYATISGEFRSEGHIDNIEINPFITNEKLKLKYIVNNAGNIDFQTSTNFEVTSLSGKQLYADTSIDTILPGSSKEIEVKWENTPAFGIYNFNYKIRYLDQVIEKSQIIIITPRIVLFIFLLLAMGAIVLIAYRIRLRATRKRH